MNYSNNKNKNYNNNIGRLFLFFDVSARQKGNANDSKASSFYNKHIQKYSWRFDAYGNKSIVSVWKEVKKSIFELQLPVGWFGLSE